MRRRCHPAARAARPGSSPSQAMSSSASRSRGDSAVSASASRSSSPPPPGGPPRALVAGDRQARIADVRHDAGWPVRAGRRQIATAADRHRCRPDAATRSRTSRRQRHRRSPAAHGAAKALHIAVMELEQSLKAPAAIILSTHIPPRLSSSARALRAAQNLRSLRRPRRRPNPVLAVQSDARIYAPDSRRRALTPRRTDAPGIRWRSHCEGVPLRPLHPSPTAASDAVAPRVPLGPGPSVSSPVMTSTPSSRRRFTSSRRSASISPCSSRLPSTQRTPAQ